MALPSILTESKECCVKYQLFTILEGSFQAENKHEDPEYVIGNYVSKLAGFLQKYIWQNESFNLRSINRNDGELCIEGCTNYGDNIEDEWFIVFLLLHLTKEDENLIVKVEDSDGDFLLIEAADHLPKWCNPETSENRVFLYRGGLHLLPLASSPAEVTISPGGTPTISQALMTVRAQPEVTKASQAIQEAVLNRIKGYPERITELHHRAHCYIPSNLAVLLAHHPSLISSAVSAFYHRDPIDLKACQAMKYFPPETRVMSQVTFTRCLYAQLVQQKFEPDRRTGWNLPNIRSPSYPSHSIGVKLACGFEILASRASSVNSEKPASEDTQNMYASLELDTRWKAFVSSLTRTGYFRGELEGSRLYKELLEKASHFYIQSVQPDISLTSSDSIHVGQQILSLLSTIDVDYEQLKKAEKELSPPDDDSWLDLTPDLLDSILDEYSKRTAVGDSHSADGTREKELAATITGTLKDFVDGTSSFEGVEPSCQKTNERNKPQSKNNRKNNNNYVDFDADGFADAVRSILYFKEPDSDSLSSSSMSGYSDEETEDVPNQDEGKSVLLQKPERPPRRKDKARLAASSTAAVEEMKQYMAQMDKELAATDVGQSFERTQTFTDQEADQLNDSIEEECDDFRPVDIDLTALKNILESYNSEGGLPGPASTLLQSMGLSLPQDADKQ